MDGITPASIEDSQVSRDMAHFLNMTAHHDHSAHYQSGPGGSSSGASDVGDAFASVNEPSQAPRAQGAGMPDEPLINIAATEAANGGEEHPSRQPSTASDSQQPEEPSKKRKVRAAASRSGPHKKLRSDSRQSHAVETSEDATAPTGPNVPAVPEAHYQNIFESSVDAHNPLNRVGVSVTYQNFDIAEDDWNTVSQNDRKKLYADLFGQLFQSPARADGNLPTAERKELNDKHEKRFNEVKTRMTSIEDQKDASARIWNLIDKVLEVHEKGVPQVDLTSVKGGQYKTKTGYLIDQKTTCLARFERIKIILKEDKRVVYDIINRSDISVTQDLACAPDAYAERKASNSKSNQKKEKLHAMGRKARDKNKDGEEMDDGVARSGSAGSPADPSVSRSVQA